MELLVVVLLQGDLDDGVVLGVSLLGYTLEVAVRSATQPLKSPEYHKERKNENCTLITLFYVCII